MKHFSNEGGRSQSCVDNELLSEDKRNRAIALVLIVFCVLASAVLAGPFVYWK